VLDAGVPLRDVQDAASRAGPRTTIRRIRRRSRPVTEPHPAIPAHPLQLLGERHQAVAGGEI